MKKYLLIISILILIIIIVGSILFFINYMKKSPTGLILHETTTNSPKLIQQDNGAVVNIWLHDKSKVNVLRDNGIKYLFVDVGDTGLNGKIETDETEIKEFIDFIKSYEKELHYEFILLPYSEVNTYDYDITSKEFRNNFLNDYKRFIELGFDGVYVDIEPVKFNERKLYLNFLDELRANIDSGKIISVYSGSLKTNGGNNEWEWDKNFYKEVGNRVDLIFVPGYDTHINLKNNYEKHVKNQVEEISKLNLKSKVILGVPTHKSYPENLENSLNAYYNAENNKFIGVAIFSEWTATNSDWKIFESKLKSQL